MTLILHVRAHISLRSFMTGLACTSICIPSLQPSTKIFVELIELFLACALPQFVDLCAYATTNLEGITLLVREH